MIGQNMYQFVSTFSASGQPPKETCRQCRFRKVRCDGKHGEKGCGDCERLKFTCSFVVVIDPADPTTTQTTTTTADSSISSQPSPTLEAGRVVERRRTGKACTHCRQQKVRCSGGAPCLSCKKKGTNCVYGTDRRRGSRVATSGSSIAGTPTETTFPGHTGTTTRSSLDDISQSGADDTSGTSATSPRTRSPELMVTATTPSSRAGAALLPPDLQVLVEYYFNHVYALPSYAFLHPQTTLQQCHDGNLETCLAYALSAVASHHKHPSSGRRGAMELGWIQAAEDFMWKHLESPTIPRLQALLLIVLYRLETGAFQRAFMLSSIAARGAAAMRLNYERITTPDAAGRTFQEVRRRLTWSLKLVERYFSLGLPEFELCPVENIYLELPCWEEEFSGASATASASASASTNAGPHARTLQSSDFGSYQLCVKMEMLRRDIMKLTRSLSIHDTPFPRLPAVLHDFAQHLAQLGAALPNGPTLTAERIAQLLDTPAWLPRQLLVHLSFHQCHCDLYRLLLPGYREAARPPVLDALDRPLLARAELLCLQHATAIVDILATLNQQSQRVQLLEFDTAICGYHATRILLFIARFGSSGSSGSSSSLPSPAPAPAPAGPAVQARAVISEEWARSRAELAMASLRRFFPTSRLVRPVLEEMQRAIAVFSSPSATATPSRLASPGPSSSSSGSGSGNGNGSVNGAHHPGKKDPTAGLSAAARVRQRLAIHSLLRQADFEDEEDNMAAQDKGDSDAALFSPSSSSSTFGVHWHGNGNGNGTETGTPAASGLDALGTSSSAQSVPLPETPSDGQFWQGTWFDNGDAPPLADRCQWGPSKTPSHHHSAPGAAASGAGPPSLSFPWLQRWEGSSPSRSEVT